MHYTNVQSSMINLVGYDPDSQTLEVRFVENGLTYQYFAVPSDLYQALLASDSKGQFMRENVIDCFTTVKLKGRRKETVLRNLLKQKPTTKRPSLLKRT